LKVSLEVLKRERAAVGIAVWPLMANKATASCSRTQGRYHVRTEERRIRDKNTIEVLAPVPSTLLKCRLIDHRT